MITNSKTMDGFSYNCCGEVYTLLIDLKGHAHTQHREQEEKERLIKDYKEKLRAYLQAQELQNEQRKILSKRSFWDIEAEVIPTKPFMSFRLEDEEL